LISVVIPALDEEEHIAACLRSLQAQTRRADEIIVVDNGSFDSTADVARSAGARVISFPRPDIRMGSIGLVRQQGVEAAQGDLIVSTDADCVYSSDWLQRIEDYFAGYPSLAVLGGPAFPSNRDTLNDLISGLGNWWRSYVAGWNVPYFLGSNTSFRKEAFNRTDGYRGAAAHGPLEEWVVSFRLSRVGDWIWDDDLVVYTEVPEWSRAYTVAIPLSASALIAWAALA
jgi:glycosyltransferase involved in cell wall biosynthesis